MNIKLFKNDNIKIIKDNDNTERDICYSIFENCILSGRNTYYPNTLIYSNDNLINPYDEKVMSLNKNSFYDDNKFDINIENINKILINEINYPVFFFIYNFDNYYHFLYDTLPYLYTFLYLKKFIPNIKLLVNYPNKNMNKFYKFNIEFLEKIININDDLLIHNDNNYYNKIYISTSLTHGGYSNNPPRKEIFEIYDKIKNNINLSNISSDYINLDKIYISRRTWINNDKSNIGTDYTTRRKMMNEDELVVKLEENGYKEIFAENLNTDEKIYLFSKAKYICGSIGGGMANLLFSNKETKTIVIVTPYFLEINFRFKYSLENTDINYFYDVNTYLEDNKIPLYCRIEITNQNSKYYKKYGETVGFENNKYLVNISDNDIAGFNNNIKFNNDWVFVDEFKLLDKGLNSPYIIDITKFIYLI